MTDRRPEVAAVMFDLDMTLVDTRIDLANTANALRREFGLHPIPTATAISHIGDGVEMLVARSLGEAVVGREKEALASFRRIYREHCLDYSRPYEGIPSLTARLPPLRLGVVSNKQEAFCRLVLDGVGLGDRFDVIIGGDTTGALKPDKAPLLEACRRLEVEPDSAIMVGDTWRDVRVGKSAGSRTIAVTYGLDSRERLVAEAPDAVAETVAELGDVIAGWRAAKATEPGTARRTVGNTVLELARGDITREGTDAIVNAANSALLGGGGVDGAIHRAGGPAILEACRKIRATQGELAVGRAVITTGGRLKARFVIHTVGPIHGSSGDQAALLASCYRESLALAVANGMRSIAFPAISTGAYGYPLDEAARVSLTAVTTFLEKRPPIDLVRFVLFGEDAYQVYASALAANAGGGR